MSASTPGPARLLVLALAVALVVGVAVAPARADRETAAYFTARGDKALKDKKWDVAQEQYRRGLEEEEGHLPARFGLGEALLGAGDRGAAVEEWRRAVTDGEALNPMPAGWADVLAKARKRLAEVDAAGAGLEQIVDKQVEDLLGFAARWSPKDPDVAAKALRSVMRMRPGNTRAAAMLEKLGLSATDEWRPLLTGKDMSGWVGMNVPNFQFLDGAVVANIHDAAYFARSEAHFTGDFDVRMEAKLLEENAGTVMFALCGAFKTDHQTTKFGILTDNLVLREEDPDEEGGKREVFASHPSALEKPFDPKKWNVYELHFRGDEVHALINGTEVASRPRAKARDEGFVALIVQDVKVAFRKVDALQR